MQTGASSGARRSFCKISPREERRCAGEKDRDHELPVLPLHGREEREEERGKAAVARTRNGASLQGKDADEDQDRREMVRIAKGEDLEPVQSARRNAAMRPWAGTAAPRQARARRRPDDESVR